MGTDEQNQEMNGTKDADIGITRNESLDDEDYISPLSSEEISSFMAEMRKQYSALVVDRLEETAEHDEETGGRNIVVIDGMEDAMIGTVSIPLDKSKLAKDKDGKYYGKTESEIPDSICVAVYEEELCVEALARKYMKSGDYKTEEEAYEAAQDNFGYNTMGYYPNWKQRAPLMIRGFNVDRDKWEAFLDA